MNFNSVMSSYNVMPQKQKVANNEVCLNDSYNHNIKFTSNTINSGIKTQLTTKEENQKYNEICKYLDKHSKKALNYTLKNGILLNGDSNDNSTVLDNLYNIATKKRADGLDNSKILNDTLISIVNPYTITQKFGDIPEEYKSKVINSITNNSKNLIIQKKAEQEITNLFSGCCVAASEQFNLAKNKPAEYARFVEGLSSTNRSVEKEIKLDSLSKNTGDAIWLLNSFEIPYDVKDFNSVIVKIAPDDRAYIRAEMQQKYRDNKERSSVDVLMQSAFMNIGSQQTYNSLNDKRSGKFSTDDSGLIDYEKTFLESVVEDKNTMSVTYQNVDENQILTGYTTDFATTQSQLTETLDRGQNVIIGYTITDDGNHIIGAHEITVTGYKNDNGKLTFICNDTDDDKDEAIEYPAEYIIPKIHHAGIPEDIAMRNMENTDIWRLNLRQMQQKA